MISKIFAVGYKGDLLTKHPDTGKIVILKECEPYINIGDKISYQHIEKPDKKFDFGIEVKKVKEETDTIDTSILEAEFPHYSDFGHELRVINNLWRSEYRELLIENGKKELSDTFQEGIVYAARLYLDKNFTKVKDYITIMTKWCDNNERTLQGIDNLKEKFSSLEHIINDKIIMSENYNH